jgi:dimethylhistidine N-methyltransferase
MDNMHAQLNTVTLAKTETRSSAFKTDVLRGLSQQKKRLDAKYFYDEAGSGLYDEICRLSEYYPYQAELSILPAVSRELGRSDIFEIVEFGAGSLIKIKALLSGINTVRRFVPVDISAEHLDQACRQLRGEFSRIDICPIATDFTRLQELPEKTKSGRIGFFPGSTIGNFDPVDAVDLLRCFNRVLGEGARLVIGVDQKKDAHRLHRAYNDEQNVTARFNLNLLSRINRELGADFKLDRFEHYAFYSPMQERVEMHLVSKIRQNVRVAGCMFRFERGESIHTENSYKYSRAGFRRMAEASGWSIEQRWVDRENLFAVYLMNRKASGAELIRADARFA